MHQLKRAIRTARRHLPRLIDGFVPESMASDPLASKKARMFVTSHLMGPILGGAVPIALWALDPTPGYDIAILAVAITSFWLFPDLLRRGVPFNALVMLSIFIDWFAILWSAYFYGGVASPTMIWVLIIPILAIFYIGGDSTLKPWLAALSAACFLSFVALYVALDPPPNDIPPKALMALGVVSVAGVLCYVAGMAIYYAKIFDAGVDLETEVKRRKALAVELRRAVAAAERASSAKSEFLARMSHELRNPLNAIIGYGELLREEVEDAASARDIDRIVDAGRYLVRLINMILDLSKIEAGRMTFDRRPHDVAGLVRDAAERHRSDIEAGGNTLAVEAAPDLAEAVVDHGRVGEVLDAVLSNAAKHTQGGSVRIVARTEGSGAAGRLTLVVEDTGEGIPTEVLPTIFETFSTEREAAASRYGGTGLNLAVGSRLCDAMGGSISAESVEGEGATFTIVLPLAPAEAHRGAPVPPPQETLPIERPRAA